MAFVRRALPAFLVLWLSGCGGHSGVRRFNSLVAEGRWLSARELAEETLRQRPKDAALSQAVATLDRRAEQQALNSDFDPKRYFYAQAYLDFFKRKRFVKAVEDMEQVLSYELDNEEMLHFMDKAQPKLDAEQRQMAEKVDGLLSDGVSAYRENQFGEALESAQRALALAPSDARAKKLAAKATEAMAAAAAKASKPGKGARPPKPAPPPAPPAEWQEARFAESLRAYAQNDILTTRDILRELNAKVPGNPRYRAALERIEKELPPDRR